MSPTTSRTRTTIGAALRQARIDLRTNLLTGAAVSYLISPITVIIVMRLAKNSPIRESSITIAENFLPAMLAFGLIMGCLIGVASELTTEREDGTMVRMKAVPHGLHGYLVGKTLTQLILNFATTALTLIPAIIFFPSLAPSSAARWLLLFAIFILGVAALMPLGALVGARLGNMAHLTIVMFGAFALAGISGLFYPLAASPGWMQAIGQVFPLYWLGLGFRQALLPAEAAMLEIGGSWRTIEMFAALGVWTLLGLLVAPRALRRMIRGVSGSKIAEARERVLSRGY